MNKKCYDYLDLGFDQI